MGDAILVDVEGAVATVTMNRPDTLNAQSEEWTTDFALALDELEANRDIRCVILTGAGRAFCAGGDLNHPTFTTDGLEARRPNVEGGYELFRRLHNLPVPIIAAVNGPAAGAGVTVAAACTLRIAAQSAFFQLAFVNVGVLPDQGGCHLVPQIIGMGRAMHMALTGERVSAESALHMGLVSDVVEDDKLMARAREMAENLASKPPLALRYIKRSIYDLPYRSFDEAMTIEADHINYLIGTDDCREAIAAFKEKRPGVFKGC